MKVETPQILWNSEGDKGINAALNSISMLESGLSEHADDETTPTTSSTTTTTNTTSNNNNGPRRNYGNVMVTAGNTHIINLWKLSFSSPQTTTTGSSSGSSNASAGMVQKQSSAAATKIDYLCSLTRQEQSVNTVAFSPDGLHLATGGETGAIVVWSVPPSKRGGGNGRHYWSTVQREQDLNVRIVSRSGEGVCDISWSADSKRFVAGTIDHTVLVCEDRNFDANHQRVGGPAVDSDWQVVLRNNSYHSHYVQGVAYDPLGVYIASMGSDRTVRVVPRKTPPKSKKKILRPVNNTSPSTKMMECIPPPEHQRMVDQLLTDSKLEVANKTKLIKFRKTPAVHNHNNSTPLTSDETGAAANEHNTTSENPPPKPQRSQHMYADESTLESFFRRLSWTTDGAYLVTPAALYHHSESSANHTNGDSSSSSSSTNNKEAPSFATYLFARHKFDEPCKVLSGLEKVRFVLHLHSWLLLLLPLLCAIGPSVAPTQAHSILFFFPCSHRWWSVPILSCSDCKDPAMSCQDQRRNQKAKKTKHPPPPPPAVVVDDCHTEVSLRFSQPTPFWFTIRTTPDHCRWCVDCTMLA